MKLRFLRGNAKLDASIWTFSLPAGHSCPFAKKCLSKANRINGKIRDGVNTEYRCYAASAEALLTNVRRSRWSNYRKLLKCNDTSAMAQLILDSLPATAATVRIHASGDFFSQRYFDAWLAVARERPSTLFYGYTKALPYWIKRLDAIPNNMVLTASYGGHYDHLIDAYSLKNCTVVYSPQIAKAAGLRLDHDDSIAQDASIKRFALLLHGTQPAGTKASEAWSKLRGTSNGGYVGDRGQYLDGYKRRPLEMAGVA